MTARTLLLALLIGVLIWLALLWSLTEKADIQVTTTDDSMAFTPTMPATTSKPTPTTSTSLEVTTTTQPRARTAPTERTVRVQAVGNVWDALQACECPSGWHCNTGNGYFGGLQFSAATWAQAGGHRYASNAHLATREQQIAIAGPWLAKTSWAQWPTCSKRLGLR